MSEPNFNLGGGIQTGSLRPNYPDQNTIRTESNHPVRRESSGSGQFRNIAQLEEYGKNNNPQSPEVQRKILQQREQSQREQREQREREQEQRERQKNGTERRLEEVYQRGQNVALVSSVPSLKLDYNEPVGLKPIGKTSFANCILQILYWSLPEIHRQFYDYRFVNDRVKDVNMSTAIELEKMVVEIGRLFAVLNAFDYSFADPNKFIDSIQSGDYSVTDLDSMKFYEDLIKTLGVALSQSSTKKFDETYFTIKETIEYTRNSDKTAIRAPEYSTRTKINIPVANFTDLMSSYQSTLTEKIENFPVSSKGKTASVTKTVYPSEFPPIVCFHLDRTQNKRLNNSENVFRFDKEITLESYHKSEIEYPENYAPLQNRLAQLENFQGSGKSVLEILGLSLQVAQEAVANEYILNWTKEKYEQYTKELNQTKSEINQIKEKYGDDTPTTESHQYLLSGIIVHEGQQGLGHYFVFIHQQETDSWYRFSDTNVTQMKEKEVFQISFGKMSSTQTCALFYRVANSTSQFPSPPPQLTDYVSKLSSQQKKESDYMSETEKQLQQPKQQQQQQQQQQEYIRLNDDDDDEILQPSARIQVDLQRKPERSENDFKLYSDDVDEHSRKFVEEYERNAQNQQQYQQPYQQQPYQQQQQYQQQQYQQQRSVKTVDDYFSDFKRDYERRKESITLLFDLKGFKEHNIQIYEQTGLIKDYTKNIAAREAFDAIEQKINDPNKQKILEGIQERMRQSRINFDNTSVDTKYEFDCISHGIAVATRAVVAIEKRSVPVSSLPEILECVNLNKVPTTYAPHPIWEALAVITFYIHTAILKSNKIPSDEIQINFAQLFKAFCKWGPNYEWIARYSQDRISRFPDAEWMAAFGASFDSPPIPVGKPKPEVCDGEFWNLYSHFFERIKTYLKEWKNIALQENKNK